MGKSAPIIVASFTLAGVILGSWLSYYFQLRSQEEASLREQRISAYTTFYSAQVLSRTARDLRHDGRHDEAEEMQREFQRLDHKAHFELAIYGTGKVIRATAKYFRDYYPVGYCRDSRGKMIADLAMYQAMRAELYRDDKEQVPPEDLARLLFYCELRPEQEEPDTN